MKKESETTQELSESNLGLIELIKRLFKLYRQYFGFDAQNISRTLKFCGIIIGNFLLAFSLVFVNTSMRSLMGLLTIPGVTYTGLILSASQCLLAITIYGSITAIDAILASNVGSSLSYAINQDIEEKWIKTKAYYGSKLISERKKYNAAQLLSDENNTLHNRVMELFDNYLTTVSNFVVSMIGLYSFSVPLDITLFSLSFAIPGYLVISTVLYAIVYNYFTQRVGASLEDYQTKQRNLESKIQRKIHHIEGNAESIAFKKGETFEHQSLFGALKKSKIVQQYSSKIRAVLTFLTNLHAEFSSYFAILLCAPNIISQKLSFSSILEIPYLFQNAVNMFTWKSDNFDTLTDCAVSLKRLEALQRSISEWESLQKHSEKNLEQSFDNVDGITINNFTLRKPNGEPIIQNFNAHFPKGKITLLQGESGAGKTSLMRALAGLSPFASGDVAGFSKNIHFIPSHPYFPEEATLLESILYPRRHQATHEEIMRIKSLMKSLGFKKAIIDDLQTMKDWSGPYLSDGEKQRIEIISAIMKNPDILLMDEPTSRVDHDKKTNNKGRIEGLLKEHLPNTTIIYTDHNPSVNGAFNNNQVHLTRSSNLPKVKI